MAKSNNKKKRDGRFLFGSESPVCIDFYYKMILPKLVR